MLSLDTSTDTYKDTAGQSLPVAAILTDLPL